MLSRLRVISLGNRLRIIRTLGLGTMTILSRKLCGGYRSQSQQRFSASTPSSSVPSSKNKYDVRAPGSKSQGSVSGNKTYMLYAFQARQDQEGSSDVVTRMSRVFDLDIYALLDSGATLSFVTPYLLLQFNVSGKTLSKPFSVSTPIGDKVIARRVYKNCSVTVYQKVTSVDLVELEMVDFVSF